MIWRRRLKVVGLVFMVKNRMWEVFVSLPIAYFYHISFNFAKLATISSLMVWICRWKDLKSFWWLVILFLCFVGFWKLVQLKYLILRVSFEVYDKLSHVYLKDMRIFRLFILLPLFIWKILSLMNDWFQMRVRLLLFLLESGLVMLFSFFHLWWIVSMNDLFSMWDYFFFVREKVINVILILSSLVDCIFLKQLSFLSYIFFRLVFVQI